MSKLWSCEQCAALSIHNHQAFSPLHKILVNGQEMEYREDIGLAKDGKRLVFKPFQLPNSTAYLNQNIQRMNFEVIIMVSHLFPAPKVWKSIVGLVASPFFWLQCSAGKQNNYTREKIM